MSTTLADLVAVEQLGPDEYVSKVTPIRMGNAAPIAYGGCTIAIALRAACETAPKGFTPYSVLGQFLGPASTEQKLYCSVQRTRSTRSFATRRVQVKQKQKDGSERVCLEMSADFHIEEPTLIDYSAPTVSPWPHPEDCPSTVTHAEALARRGVVSDAQLQEFKKKFGISASIFDTRYCTNSVGAQNLAGAIKNVVTTQENLPITSKTSAEWQRCRSKLETPAANFAAVGWLMDGALSFTPMTHNHLWFEDTSACSTLDFALRVFVPEIDMEAWTLKERFTIRGGGARTYSEGRLFDDKGQMVASMTQQSILRPPRKDAKSSKM